MSPSSFECTPAGAPTRCPFFVHPPALSRNSNRRLAYAFYATDDLHALAVLTFVSLLRERGVGDGIGMLALHHGVSKRLVAAMDDAGIQPHRVKALRRVGRLRASVRSASDRYFLQSLTKLRLFEPNGYDRLVYADTDSIPLRSLDPLFELEMRGPLAAPSAYWHPQPWWTTALMVIDPGDEAWRRVSARAATAGSSDHDMDVVNEEFGDGEIETIDPEVFALDSEWVGPGADGALPRRKSGLDRVSLVHFSALGKPWWPGPEAARERRPGAPPEFFQLREKWMDAYGELSHLC